MMEAKSKVWYVRAAANDHVVKQGDRPASTIMDFLPSLLRDVKNTCYVIHSSIVEMTNNRLVLVRVICGISESSCLLLQTPAIQYLLGNVE